MILPRALLAVLVCLPVAALTAPSWEPIAADLRNVRGICYLPVYPSRDGAPDYYDVASSTAMWHEYDAHPRATATPPQGTAGHVWEQLGWLRRMGINTVRVWLSFPLWEWHHDHPTGPTNPCVDKLRHFVRLCEARRMYVMPVLWDSLGFIAVDYANPIGATMRAQWHPNPGAPRIATLIAENPTLAGTKAEAYLQDVIDAFAPSQALLAWDLMNEPHMDAAAEQFIMGTLRVLDARAPETKTNLGLLWAEDRFPFAGRFARDPRLDTFAIHPYGHTRASIAAALWDATHVSDGQGGFVQKPVLASEIGKPGWAMAYQDGLDYAATVARDDLGPNERGIGTTPWGAMIGTPAGLFPFKETDGIFFGDGKVRERDVVLRFVAAARAQGVPKSQLFAPEEVVEATGPGRVAQDLPVHCDDWEYLERRLWQTREDYALLSWSEMRETIGVFRMVSLFLDVGSLCSASNPINDGSVPGNVLSAADRTGMVWYAQNVWPPGTSGLSNDLVLAVSAMIGMPFDPQNDASHRAAFCTTLLHHWRLILLPYVGFRGGPP